MKIINKKFNLISSKLNEKSRDYIITTLGKPNEVFEEDYGYIYSYYAAPGNQCVDNSFDDQIDVLRLLLKMEENKVVDVFQILP